MFTTPQSVVMIMLGWLRHIYRLGRVVRHGMDGRRPAFRDIGPDTATVPVPPHAGCGQTRKRRDPGWHIPAGGETALARGGVQHAGIVGQEYPSPRDRHIEAAGLALGVDGEPGAVDGAANADIRELGAHPVIVLLPGADGPRNGTKASLQEAEDGPPRPGRQPRFVAVFVDAE